MPCTMTGSLEGDRALFYQEESERLTRIACEMAQWLEASGDLGKCSTETRKWWKEHKAWDAAREKREKKGE